MLRACRSSSAAVRRGRRQPRDGLMTGVQRELFHRSAANPILSASDWPYPVNVVFNPGAAVVDGETVLLARVEALTGVSHLTVARSANGVDGWSIDAEPLLAPAAGVESEQWGFEDPRTVWVPELDRWVITCTVVRPGRARRLPRDHQGLPHRRAARHRQAARGQERGAPAGAHRRAAGSSSTGR